MTFLNDVADDIQDLVTDGPTVTAAVDGTDVTGNLFTAARDIDAGVTMQGHDAMLWCASTDWATASGAHGSTVVIGATTYTVTAIEDDLYGYTKAYLQL